MGAHVQRTSLECQWYQKWDEKLDSHAAKKGAKNLVSSGYAKILEYESSDYNKRNMWEKIVSSPQSNKSY